MSVGFDDIKMIVYNEFVFSGDFDIMYELVLVVGVFGNFLCKNFYFKE